MAEVVDTRVVEAKFDAQQFEQGVDKTVKKLDELKKSLNLKDADKSIAEIGDKISVSSEKASGALEQLQERFTSFAGMLKQKFLGGIADEVVGALFKIENGVKNLVTSLSTAQIGAGMQRYTDILTSVRTLTAAGVGQDTAYIAIERLGDYADQTSYSLDELVSTMAKFKTAGADLDTARRMVEGLSNAAASMGVNAQQASRAYLNMQQAYSKGVMLSEDWRSFESLPMVGEKFNQTILDAAVKVGTLKKEADGTYTAVAKAINAAGGNVSGSKKSTSTLGKGITAQNMGTKLGSKFFTKQVMEEVFGNSYYFEAIERSELNIIKETEKRLKQALKEGRITQDQMDEELQKDLDKMAAKRLKDKTAELDAALAAGTINAEEYKKQLDDFNKSNTMTVFGYNAFRAGQEARSLNDVLLTLKDTISRGWAKTFEYLFGKLDDAADFFTALTESNLANAIYAIGDIRNAILEIWATPGVNGSASGRDNIIAGLQQFDDLLGSIFEKMGLIRREKTFFDQAYYDKLLGENGEGTAAAEAYRQQMEKLQKEYDEFLENASDPFEDFVNNMADSLMMMSRQFRIFAEQVNDFFTKELVNGETRLQRIEHVVRGIAEAIKIVTEAAFGLWNRVLKPLAETSFTNIEKAIQPFLDLINPDLYNDSGENMFTKVSDGIEDVLSIGERVVTILTPVIDILGDVLKFFAEMAAGSIYSNIEFFSDALGLVSELFLGKSAQSEKGKGILDGLAASVQALGDACKSAFGSVFGFLDSVIKDIRVLIGLDEGDLKKDGLFSHVVNWFNTDDALVNIRAKIDNVITGIREFVADLPNRIRQAAEDIPNIIQEFFNGLFYKRTISQVTSTGVIYHDVPTELKKWLDQAIADTTAFILDIPNKILSIPSLIGEFFHGILYKEEYGGHEYKDGRLQSYNKEVPTALKVWLDQAQKDVEAFIASLPEKISKIPSIVGGFIDGLFSDRVVHEYKNGKLQSHVVKGSLAGWLKQAIKDVKAFIKDIPNKLKSLPSLVNKLLEGLFYTKKVSQVTSSGTIYQYTKTPLKEMLDTIIKTVREFISNIPTYIGQAIGTVGSFIGTVLSAVFGETADGKVNVENIIESVKNIGRDIINGIVSVFSGTQDWSLNRNWLADKIKEWVGAIRDKAIEVWPEVQEWFIGLPRRIANFFSNGTTSPEENSNSELGTAISGFISGIATWLSTLPDTLLTAYENAEKEFGNVWDTIIGWITGNDKAGTLNEKYQNRLDNFLNSNKYASEDEIDAFKNSLFDEQWREDNPIAANISAFFEHLIEFVGKKIADIPNNIKTAWDSFVMLGTILIDVIKGEKQEDYGSPLYNMIADTFDTVVKWIGDNISGLPDKIKAGWNKVVDIGKVIGDVLFGGKTVFDQKEYDSILNADGLNKATKKMEAEIYKNSTIDFGSDTYNAIGRFFENIRDWIRERIEDLPSAITRGWEAFKDFGAKVGPTIISGLQKGLEWIKTGLGTLTTWLETPATNESGEKLSVIESIDKYFEDPGHQKYKALWDGIKSFGESIGDFFAKTIPEFISAAVKKIATELPNILSGIFNGNSLFGGLFGGKDNTEKQVEEAVKKSGEEAAGALRKHYNGSYATPVETVINQLTHKKPSVNQNRSKDEDFDYLISYLTPGDSTKTQEVKENSKSFIEIMSEMFGMSRGLAEDSADAGKNGETIEKNATGFLGGITTVIDKVKGVVDDVGNASVAKLLVVLGGIALILFALNKIVDNAMFLDDAIGWNAKWLGIGIALTAISGILGYITYLAATDDAKSDRFEKVKGVFEELGTFIKDLAGLVEDIVLISTIGKGLETAGDFVEAWGKKKEGKGLVASLLTQIAAFIGINAGGELLSNGISKLFESIADSFGTFAVGIDEFVQTIRPSVEELASIYGDVQTALLVIPAIEDLIKQIDTLFTEKELTDPHGIKYKVSNGADIKETVRNLSDKQQIFYALGMMMSSMSIGLKEFSTVELPKDELTRFNDFLEGKDGEFSRFLNNIVTAAYVVYDSGLKNMGDISNKESTLANVITVMSGLFSLLGSSIKDFDKGSIDDLSKFFELLNALAGGNFNADGSMKIDSLLNKHDKLAKMGMDLQKFAGNMKRFFEKTNEIRNILKGEDNIIDEDEEATFNKTFEFIKAVSEKMMTVANTADQHFVATDFEYVGNSLPKFGLNIMEFINTVNSFKPNEELNFEFLDSIMSLITKIKDAIGIATQYFRFEDVPKNLQYVAEALVGTAEDISDSEGHIGRAFGRTGGLFSELTDALSSGQFNLDDIERTISALSKLSESLRTFFEVDEWGDFKYQTALENLKSFNWEELLGSDILKPQITPVLDISTDFRTKAEELRKLLGFMLDKDGSWISPQLTVNLGELTMPENQGYSMNLTRIENKLANIEAYSRSYSSSLSGLRVTMNGQTVGYLVAPYVSEWQGYESMRNSRSGMIYGEPTRGSVAYS